VSTTNCNVKFIESKHSNDNYKGLSKRTGQDNNFSTILKSLLF